MKFPRWPGLAMAMLLMGLSFSIGTRAADNLKAFPAAEPGMTRHVIELPPQADESAWKVELMIGKTVKTDAANRYFFAGTLQSEMISGWGFERHILRSLGPMAGTLMAVDPNAPQLERFVALGGEPRLLRYNSRLPLVVYVPADVEVRYRLWRAETGGAARFVRTLALPKLQSVLVVAEGDDEARSIGSYSVRLYATAAARPDTTFYKAGLVRARDGAVEKILLAELEAGAEPSLVVVIRSAGSGGYLSADAFDLGANILTHRAQVTGLSAGADPVLALKNFLRPAAPQ